MKRVKAKVLSLLVAVAMVVMMVPVTVQAATGEVTVSSGSELQDAVNNADGETVIKLGKDITNGVGIVVPGGKNIIFDFDGHTYTVAGDPVGSQGTVTLGFQLLGVSTITFKNGILNTTYDGIKMMIQNYSNLTLDNFNVDGSHSSVQYGVSNNNGSCNITGNTSITVSGENVALDSCDFIGYQGVTVTVNTTGTITGNIELSGNNANPDPKMEIKNGTIKGTYKIYDNITNADTALTISGGSHSDPNAQNYATSSMKQVNGMWVIGTVSTGGACSHDYEWDVFYDATSTTDGKRAYRCKYCGDISEIVPISAYAKFLEETTKAIKAAPAGSVVDVETNLWVSFSKAVATAMQENPTVAVNVQFRFDGHVFKIAIPAGYDLMSKMNEEGYAGFAYLATDPTLNLQMIR